MIKSISCSRKYVHREDTAHDKRTRTRILGCFNNHLLNNSNNSRKINAIANNYFRLQVKLDMEQWPLQRRFEELMFLFVEANC